jgi:hypothetical protein
MAVVRETLVARRTPNGRGGNAPTPPGYGHRDPDRQVDHIRTWLPSVGSDEGEPLAGWTATAAYTGSR